MILFYTTTIDGSVAFLEEAEARHCVQVLRKKEGDTIFFVDGMGGFYEGTIREITKKKCTVDIIKQTSHFNQQAFHLHIAIAPTKNVSRLEWFLEKGTEIGVDEITPIICQRSERRKLRTDRLQKVLITAMKQSLKAYLPKLNEPTLFQKVLQNAPLETLKFIARGTENNALKDNYQARRNVLILIGPEGDFTEEEVRLAFKNGFQGVHLGKSRLRTETAGIIACHIVNLLNQ